MTPKTPKSHKTLKTLKKQESTDTRAFSDALSMAIEVIASNSKKSIGDILSDGLRPIAEVLDIDRIMIVRFFEGDTTSVEVKYGWDIERGGTIAVAEELRIFSVTESIARWISFLLKDICFHLKQSEFTTGESAYFKPFGVMSILMVPVFADGEFWGAVAFQDHKNERGFDNDSVALMRSVARLCASTIILGEQTKAALDEVEQRNKLLITLNTISAIMLQPNITNFSQVINQCMGTMAEAVGVDRVYIWKNHLINDVLHCTQQYEWSEGAEPQQGNELTVDISYDDNMPTWKEILSKGNCVNNIVKDMTTEEQAQLSPQGIVSILVAPVFYQNQFWGFVGFDDCKKERLFSQNEEMVLLTVSQHFADALIRNQMQHNLDDQSEFGRVMFEMAPIGLSIFDQNLKYIDCNEAILRMYGVEKQYFLDNFLEFSEEYQPDGQKSSEKLPQILRSALNGENVKIEWMHKSIKGESIPCELLVTRVKHDDKYIGLKYAYDLRNIRKMEEDILQLEIEVDKIFYDGLTGIYNRRYFDEKLELIIKTLSRFKGNLSLMMIDIDFFKKFNDTYGHIEGDKCLITVAQAISKEITRSDDFLARYGGEEFVAVLPHTDAVGAKRVAEKLLDVVRQCNIPHSKNAAADCVTISIGIASGKIEYKQNPNDFVLKADDMLYKSKQNGRNQYNSETL
ncbi:MAG: diguanylate cyclase [Holophagaceae bacterium]|nr:diguanylate cyclase [Holophagaceae bacterium]